MVVCKRGGSHPNYLPARRHERYDRNGERFFLYRSLHSAVRFVAEERLPAPPPDRADCADLAKKLESHLTDERAAQLTKALGLPAWAKQLLAKFGVGHIGAAGNRRAAWTIPERDGSGRVVGVACRHPSGTPGKSMVRGTHHGLTYAPGWRERAIQLGYVLVVEGFSDTFALTAAGQPVVGRPSNFGGVPDLVVLFRTLPSTVRVVVVGENDLKPDGRWPGRIGAFKSAVRVAEVLGRPVEWAMVPNGRKGMHKDVRDYLTTRAKAIGTVAKWEAVGRSLVSQIIATAVPAEEADLVTAATSIADSNFPRQACKDCYFLKLEGKADGTNAGRRCVVAARCDRWRSPVCTTCPSTKAHDALTSLAESLLPYISTTDATALGPDDFWGDPGHLSSVGPWNLFASVVTLERFQRVRQSVSKSGGEQYRVRTALSYDELMAFESRNVRVKQESNQDSIPLNPHVSDSPPDRHLVLVVLPPEATPPRGFAPVAPTVAIRLVAASLTTLLEQPEMSVARLRPIGMSDGLRLPEREEVGSWHRTPGLAAYPPAVVKREITTPLGIDTPVMIAGRNLQGVAAGWRSTPVLGWTLSELLTRPPGDHPANPPAEIVKAYNRWKKTLTAEVVDGPEVRRIVGLYLWDGLPSWLRSEIDDAMAKDREFVEEQAARERFHSEANELRRQVMRQYADNPLSVPRFIRDHLLVRLESRRTRRKRWRNPNAPKWRARNWAKTPSNLNVLNTVGR